MADKERAESPGIVSLTMEQFQELMGKMGGFSGDLKTILAESGKATAEAMRQSLRPENATAPGISALNPLGERDHPRPELRRETFLCGHRLSKDELTKEELDLLNAFEATRESRNGSWRADVRRNGSTEQLFVSFPSATIDDRMNLPPLTQILRELLGGKEAADPDALARRVQELERMVSDLTAPTAAR